MKIKIFITFFFKLIPRGIVNKKVKVQSMLCVNHSIVIGTKKTLNELYKVLLFSIFQDQNSTTRKGINENFVVPCRPVFGYVI